MTAAVRHLPVRAPQDTPQQAGLALAAAMYEAGILEGQRRAREELGVPVSRADRKGLLTLLPGGAR